MKRCSRCKATKPVSDFNLKSRASAKLMSWCKVCKLAAKRLRRAAMAGQPDPTIEARYWPKVGKAGPDECWNWLGALSNRGYGAIYFQGADQPAHRVAVLLDGREVPAGMVVDHMCKNIRCVNPRHLRVCTQVENTTIYSDNAKRSATLKAVWARKRAAAA